MARQSKSRLPKSAAAGTYVALMEKRGKVYEAQSAFGDEEAVFVGRKSLGDARDGDLVLLRSDGRGRGEVIRVIGKSRHLPAIMEAILAHYRVPRGFSPAGLAEANAAAERALAHDESRHDLTGMDSITIDPDEARDYDDAITLQAGPGDGETTLFVHIADVSYYIRDGSILDAEARKKSCSVYMPVAVEPMLPEILSSDVCSLRPDTERKCVTTEMIFDWPLKSDSEEESGNREKGGRGAKKGRGAKDEKGAEAEPPPLLPKKVRFYRSVIRSRRRLTYNEVDDLFEDAVHLGDEQIEQLLGQCRAFARDLRAARHARGALNIETFEPEFRLDENGEVIGVRPRPESESHALIEEFMIAANEAVARFLERKDSSCIYRIHEEPDAQAVDALFDLLEDLGVATPSFSLAKGTPQAAGEAIRQMLKSLPTVLSEKQKSASVFGEIVLRSLKQAIYLEENLGHFGLASPAYLHFTSPIRRYPDLVVHRALMRELGIEDLSCDRVQVAETARISSDNERRAALVERKADDVVLAFLLDRVLFESGWDRVFAGEIVSVIPSGLFIRFERTFEGYVPARKLWGDYFAISDKGSALVGRRKGRPFRLGDSMNVRVTRIDKLRGKVELEPAK
jgi:ribonuclease R